jgi:hypothetical protein
MENMRVDYETELAGGHFATNPNYHPLAIALGDEA